MFGIFKKRESYSTSNPLAGFGSEFTQEQKAAIIASLYVIAQSDGHLHQKEMLQINQVASILNVNINDPAFARLAPCGKDVMIRVLNTLTQYQKEWFAVTLNGLVAADGKIDKIELNIAVGICGEIGISEDKYVEIVQKAHLLMEKFMG
jgi:uncharacterized tellurite resistance protein B-like protein